MIGEKVEVRLCKREFILGGEERWRARELDEERKGN